MRICKKIFGALSVAVLCAIIAAPANAQTWIQVPGTLTQISVGNSTTIWGVNSSNSIYDYNGATWTQVPGLLTQVAVGSDGTVWGINAYQQVYQYQSLTNSWTNIPGSLTSISVGGKDMVWGLNSSGSVYRFDPGIQAWDHITGVLTQLSVASDGTVIGLNAGQLFYFEPMSQLFQGVTGVSGAPPLSQVVAGFGGAVFALDTSGNIYQFNTTTQTLETLTGNLSQIAVGSNYAIYGVNAAQTAYEYNLQTALWTELPGAALTKIAVSSDGTVWGLSSTGQIYYLQPAS
jgi:virginiamycin B lyase